ncbi:hypothetical protein KVF89_25355 [Nocardioides carbamazepini]|uniref:phosphotransferase-like protein n=1 Tax=Nocardioides carbamazepini TaxID=2854259 RepID=UPI00214A774E|nr:hypothetical protein [Nocardioides carbamazepini]MCR1785887.1 hypothetical protein [Nocardioides carbamazepini]
MSLSEKFPSVCIIVNGPSAVGKSTLTSGLQQLSHEPLLRFGVDEFYKTIPAKWLAGTPNNLGKRGFQYVEHGETASGIRLRNLESGVEAIQMLLVMNVAIEAMLRAGASLIVDGQTFDQPVTTDLWRRLKMLEKEGVSMPLFIELSADPRTIDKRNSRHAHPSYIGVYQSTLASQNHEVDLQLDTSALSAPQVLQRVVLYLESRGVVLRARAHGDHVEG